VRARVISLVQVESIAYPNSPPKSSVIRILRTGVTQFRKRSSSEAHFTCSLGGWTAGAAGFPSVHFPAEGNEGRLAFLSSVRGANLRLYSDSARGGIASPRTICPFPRRVLAFASGSLEPALEIEVRDRNERARARNSVAISLRCFSRFARIAARGGFVPATYFPAVRPAFYTASGKKRRSIGGT